MVDPAPRAARADPWDHTARDDAARDDAARDDEAAGPVATAVAAVIAALVGVFVGVITTFVHGQWPLAVSDAVSLPLGLPAGLLLVACLLVGFRIVFESRVVTAATATGVLGATVVLTLPGAGGTLLALDGPVDWVWVCAPPVIAVLAVAWPRRAPRRTT